MNAESKKFMPKAIIAAVAASAVAVSAMPAAAQNYGYQAQQGYGYGEQSTYYDQCLRDRRQRQVTGAVVGGLVGLLAGRGVASRGVRSEGGALGAAAGAAIGAGMGGSTAACQPAHAAQPYGGQPYSQQPYSQQSYGYGSDYGYDDRYDNRYDDYGYGQPVRGYDQQNTDQCRLVENNIRLPDGRMETRYVRACADANGRYRVVD